MCGKYRETVFNVVGLEFICNFCILYISNIFLNSFIDFTFHIIGNMNYLYVRLAQNGSLSLDWRRTEFVNIYCLQDVFGSLVSKATFSFNVLIFLDMAD